MHSHECKAGPTTAASYTWNFKQEANNLFRDIQDTARQAATTADRLESMGENGEVSWQDQADHLDMLRSQVNDMGRKLCRLETIRRVLDPWQRKTVDRLSPELHLIANHVQWAIQFGNTNQNYLWSPVYQTYTKDAYHEASAVAHTAGLAVEYAQVQSEYHNLRGDLGLRTSP